MPALVLATSLGADPPPDPPGVPTNLFLDSPRAPGGLQEGPQTCFKKIIQPQENPKGPPKLAPKSANGQFSSPGPDILLERLPGPTGIPRMPQGAPTETPGNTENGMSWK